MFYAISSTVSINCRSIHICVCVCINTLQPTNHFVSHETCPRNKIHILTINSIKYQLFFHVFCQNFHVLHDSFVVFLMNILPHMFNKQKSKSRLRMPQKFLVIFFCSNVYAVVLAALPTNFEFTTQHLCSR